MILILKVQQRAIQVYSASAVPSLFQVLNRSFICGLVYELQATCLSARRNARHLRSSSSLCTALCLPSLASWLYLCCRMMCLSVRSKNARRWRPSSSRSTTTSSRCCCRKFSTRRNMSLNRGPKVSSSCHSLHCLLLNSSFYKVFCGRDSPDVTPSCWLG